MFRKGMANVACVAFFSNSIRQPETNRICPSVSVNVRRPVFVGMYLCSVIDYRMVFKNELH